MLTLLVRGFVFNIYVIFIYIFPCWLTVTQYDFHSDSEGTLRDISKLDRKQHWLISRLYKRLNCYPLQVLCGTFYNSVKWKLLNIVPINQRHLWQPICVHVTLVFFRQAVDGRVIFFVTFSVSKHTPFVILQQLSCSSSTLLGSEMDVRIMGKCMNHFPPVCWSTSRFMFLNDSWCVSLV